MKNKNNYIRALIAIPAFNEERNIRHLLTAIDHWKEDVLVVDDASTDNTVNVVTSMGFRCHKRKSNVGLAGFYSTARKYALEYNYTHLVLIDGDGQHDPSYIPRFIRALISNDFVCGNRFHDLRAIPPAKIASNTFARLIFKTFLNLDFPDVACGFRAIRLDSMPGKFKSTRFGIIYEMLARHALSGKSTGFVNIPALYPENAILNTRSSEITGLLSAVYQFNPSPILESLMTSVKNKTGFRITLSGSTFIAVYQIPDAYRFEIENSPEKEKPLPQVSHRTTGYLPGETNHHNDI